MNTTTTSSSTARDTRPQAVQITQNQADHQPPPEQQELMQAFRDNLEIILGGRDAMQQTLLEQYAQHQLADPDRDRPRDPSADVEPQGRLRRAFMVADYTTWMGRDRPVGAHFGILFDRVTAH